ncbi:hypothetical protein ONJ45_26695, partial [Salmonella enterica subsp. enterica serovar Virginia]|nr:hypothetical protein [Salmonella enterica subsp. enterica serovar Virginia]
LALHIKWTVEEHEFHSIIFTWPTGFLRNIVGELSAERQQIYPTGTSSTRLHFEIRYKGKSVNPLRYLPQR